MCSQFGLESSPESRDFDKILDDLHDLELSIMSEQPVVAMKTEDEACVTSSNVLDEVLEKLQTATTTTATMTTMMMMTGKNTFQALQKSKEISKLSGDDDDDNPPFEVLNTTRPFQEQQALKVYIGGLASRNAFVTSGTTSGDVLKQLSLDLDRTSLVEVIPDLLLECYLEDSDKLSDVMGAWTFDSENFIMAIENPTKYDLFKNPQRYFSKVTDRRNVPSRATEKELIQEFVRSAFVAPDCEGELHVKVDGKKSWKKNFFVLRPSGLYYCPKGKNRSLINLMCLQQLYNVRVYSGAQWKKKFKSPTEFCFALKHPKVQKQVPKFIKYFCAEDQETKDRWINLIRLAKFGAQIYSDFQANSQVKEKNSGHHLQDEPNQRFIICNSKDDYKQNAINFNYGNKSETFSRQLNSHCTLSIEPYFDWSPNDSSDCRMLHCVISRHHHSGSCADHENPVIEAVGHQKIKRTLSSGARDLRLEKHAGTSRSCPHSPRTDDVFSCASSSDHDLTSTQPKRIFRERFQQRHEESSQLSNQKPLEHFKGTERGRFAVLAGNFRERQLIKRLRTGAPRLPIDAKTKLGNEADGFKVAGLMINKDEDDFDCLPPLPIELLSSF